MFPGGVETVLLKKTHTHTHLHGRVVAVLSGMRPPRNFFEKLFFPHESHGFLAELTVIMKVVEKFLKNVELYISGDAKEYNIHPDP